MDEKKLRAGDFDVKSVLLKRQGLIFIHAADKLAKQCELGLTAGLKGEGLNEPAMAARDLCLC